VTDAGIFVEWRPRDVPLSPTAVAAVGPASAALARRLLRQPEALPSRRVVAGHEMLIVLAPQDLPWVDGVVYLGRDTQAPSLLLPTNLAPTPPLPLVERALLRRVTAPDLPIAVLVAARRLVAVGGARVVAAADLDGWLSASASA
jgi:hypothetical protein